MENIQIEKQDKIQKKRDKRIVKLLVIFVFSIVFVFSLYLWGDIIQTKTHLNVSEVESTNDVILYDR